MILNVGSNIPLIFFFSFYTHICLTTHRFTLFVFNFLISRSFNYRLLLLLLWLHFTSSLRLPCLVVWALWCKRVPNWGHRWGLKFTLQFLWSFSYQHKDVILPPNHVPWGSSHWRGRRGGFLYLHKGTMRANGGSESPAIPVRPSTFKVKIEPIEILDGKWPTATASGDSCVMRFTVPAGSPLALLHQSTSNPSGGTS